MNYAIPSPTRPFGTLLLLLLLTCGLHAQYTPPLRGALLVTGTFGELRSDHFHAGLDFRAAVGTPVYAVREGYVSRIRISGGGYGQAVYLDHPDGKRSVYGHLESLTPELLDTIRALQYARETFEIDLALNPGDIPVTAGQRIGAVGNRGFSFGPHLHFEIRESATDAPLNPLSLGFRVPDTRKPELQQLRVYEVSGAGEPVTTKTFDLPGRELPDTVRVGSERVAFAVKAIDRQNAMPNRNGIYGARILADSLPLFSFAYDRIPYDKTEYLNALTDYAEWKRNRSWFYLLHARTPKAVFWKAEADSSDTGILRLFPDRPVAVDVVGYDYAGNESVVSFVVVYDRRMAPASPPNRAFQYFLPDGEASIIDTGSMRLELDGNALYAPLRFRYVRLSDESADYLSDTHQLQDEETPLHGSAILTLRARTPVPPDLREKVYVGRCGPGGAFASAGGEWLDDGRMSTRIRGFGDYALLIDTFPPRVRIERFGTDLRGANAFSLLVENDEGGEITFRGEVDGKWVLLEYDAKDGRLTHTFAGNRIEAGRNHRFSLLLRDARGNETIFERSFRR
ncbi:M23 family metallopeptidase [Lewinella sp. JB7]|uniref:M23 family metallopeptidase n=1 Tax=Lewinella sp. JB7 TaxID=2962887 RepID=UPI0020C977D0|nr:M23 family metallopeptidase [Lewinella sp. JB7]MCP9234525.1 M23 family metallopeptidase [Lewinella sp. JB7]